MARELTYREERFRVSAAHQEIDLNPPKTDVYALAGKVLRERAVKIGRFPGPDSLQYLLTKSGVLTTREEAREIWSHQRKDYFSESEGGKS